MREIAAAELEVRRAEIRAAVTANFFRGFGGARTRCGSRKKLPSSPSARPKSPPSAWRRAKCLRWKKPKRGSPEANVRLDLSLAQSELRTARQRLASTWGNSSPIFERAEGRLEPLPSLPSAENLNARLAESPRLKLAKIEIQRRKSLADLERAKRTPDLTVSLGAMRSEELGRNQLLLGVSIPIPVFDSNRGNQIEALKRADKARDELTAMQLRLTSEVRQARERLSAARNEVQTLQADVLPGAQSAYDVATKGFELGKFNFLDVLDAQRTLFDAKSQHLRAVAETHRSSAEIDHLLASPVSTGQP